jgi:hypothetical protein
MGWRVLASKRKNVWACLVAGSLALGRRSIMSRTQPLSHVSVQQLKIALSAQSESLGHGGDIVIQTLAFQEHEKASGLVISKLRTA